MNRTHDQVTLEWPISIVVIIFKKQVCRVIAVLGFIFTISPVQSNAQTGLQDTMVLSDEMIEKYMREYRMKYDTLTFEQAIAMLAESNRQKRELLKTQRDKSRIQTIVLIGMCSLAILGALIIFITSRKLKSANVQLRKQSDRLVKNLEEKNFLLKEVHHRVKNNLQVVSSLIKLQVRTLKNDEAKIALEEGRRRIKSMALIHQNLYMHDSVSSIYMPDYMQQLVEECQVNFMVDNQNIQFQLAVDEISLDIDSALPIGLITNELISNALKHAFPGNQDGIVKITLRNNELLSLIIEDNGVGFQNNEERNGGFGLKLVQVFVEKLKATYHVSHENGTRVELKMAPVKVSA